MNDVSSVTLTREELYQRVWTTAMRRLAQEYDLSDVSLAKVCTTYRIPRPPVGYWAKEEHGKALPPTPLPDCEDPSLQRITLRLRRKDATPSPPSLSSCYDPDVEAILVRARSLPPVKVASTMRNLHPLVQATRDAFRGSRPDTHGLLFPRLDQGTMPLNIEVSETSATRALLFFSAFIRTVEGVGGKVVVEQERWGRRTVVQFAGEKVATLRLRERYRQQPHTPDPTDPWSRWRKLDYVPTGLLVLEAGRSSYEAPHCRDTEKRHRIEDDINTLVVRFAESAGRIRIRRRRAAEEQRRHEEAERIQREREAELKRRREELKARQQAEQARVDQLLAEIECWRRSRQIRAYVRHVESTVRRRCGVIDDGSELDLWLRWASTQADRFDPLVDSPPSILDEPLP